MINKNSYFCSCLKLFFILEMIHQPCVMEISGHLCNLMLTWLKKKYSEDCIKICMYNMLRERGEGRGFQENKSIFSHCKITSLSFPTQKDTHHTNMLCSHRPHYFQKTWVVFIWADSCNAKKKKNNNNNQPNKQANNKTM